jgi:hypothetical protein
VADRQVSSGGRRGRHFGRDLRIVLALGAATLALTLGGCHAAMAPRAEPAPRPEPWMAAPEPDPAPTQKPVTPVPAVEPPAPPPLAVALPPTPQTEAARLIAQAEGLARDGQPQAARETYQLVVKHYREDPARARALYELGRLLVDPSSAARDYRAAYLAFDRLTVEYPESRWTTEARAWRAALGELLAREGEASRLKEDLRRLKRMDLELEKRR